MYKEVSLLYILQVDFAIRDTIRNFSLMVVIMSAMLFNVLDNVSFCLARTKAQHFREHALVFCVYRVPTIFENLGSHSVQLSNLSYHKIALQLSKMIYKYQHSIHTTWRDDVGWVKF